MTQPIQLGIREVLLEEIKAREPKGPTDSDLQQSAVLNAAARRLNGFDHKAILTQWGELFRTGLIAWGTDLSNPDPPFFHMTQRGRQALAHLSRDPSNPDGYLRHLESMAPLKPITRSYLTEGLDCYVAGLFKAAAVMVGGAAETIVLDLRDTTIVKLQDLHQTVPKPLSDWRIKTVSDGLYQLLSGHKAKLPTSLRESFESYWPAFAHQIRSVRNEVGHPSSINPVTADTVHASLLIFPELAKLADRLSVWVRDDLA